MGMSPGVRRFAVTAHIASSVGWLGAVAAFLVHAITGLVSDDVLRVRGAYLSADTLTSAAIVPLAVAALVTGLVSSLGTGWGLLRHYWVLIKLILTMLATGVLVVHMQPIQYLAEVAGERAVTGAEFRPVQIQLVVDAGAALVVLLVTTALGVYKPRGVTGFGRRPANVAAPSASVSEAREG